jgi:hypothetical protein
VGDTLKAFDAVFGKAEAGSEQSKRRFKCDGASMRVYERIRALSPHPDSSPRQWWRVRLVPPSVFAHWLLSFGRLRFHPAGHSTKRLIEAPPRRRRPF